MGVAFYISIKDCPTDMDLSVDGKFLAQTVEHLNNYAESHGLKPLAEYFSEDPSDFLDLLSDADRELFEANEGRSSLPKEKWFQPREGVELMKLLMTYVVTKPSEIIYPDQVAADLIAFQRILEEAQERGLTWHLSIDI